MNHNHNTEMICALCWGTPQCTRLISQKRRRTIEDLAWRNPTDPLKTVNFNPTWSGGVTSHKHLSRTNQARSKCTS